jgi:hypothetical protein
MIIVAIALGCIVSPIVFGILHRTEFSRVSDPSGSFTAICTYRTYLSYLAMSPGSSSDKPCFVRIVGSKGEGYGEIPVAMIQLVGIDWHKDSAEIDGVGEWDFVRRTCWYWSDDGNRQIYVQR